jgi:hypothetical protein
MQLRRTIHILIVLFAAVSAYTIAFDVWGLAAIAPSAAAGIVPAAVLMVYLIGLKKEFPGEPINCG